MTTDAPLTDAEVAKMEAESCGRCDRFLFRNWSDRPVNDLARDLQRARELVRKTLRVISAERTDPEVRSRLLVFANELDTESRAWNGEE